MNKWISVDECLPVIEHMYPRVIVTNGSRIEIASYQGNKKWFVARIVASDMESMRNCSEHVIDDYVKDVTHWMPLPELKIKPIDPDLIQFTHNDIIRYSQSAYKRGSIESIKQLKEEICKNFSGLITGLEKELKG